MAVTEIYPLGEQKMKYQPSVQVKMEWAVQIAIGIHMGNENTTGRNAANVAVETVEEIIKQVGETGDGKKA